MNPPYKAASDEVTVMLSKLAVNAELAKKKAPPLLAAVIEVNVDVVIVNPTILSVSKDTIYIDPPS